MSDFTHKFLLEIAYKSGYSFQMWFVKFKVENGDWIWHTPEGEPSPVLLGVDDIVSIIQLEYKPLYD